MSLTRHLAYSTLINDICAYYVDYKLDSFINPLPGYSIKEVVTSPFFPIVPSRKTADKQSNESNENMKRIN